MGLFSIRRIVEAHFCTLLDESNSDFKVWFVFLIIPIIISSFSVITGIVATINIMIAVISMLAILIGFSINSMFLLVNSNNENQTSDEEELYRNTRNITLYLIIAGLITLSIAGITLIGLSNDILQIGYMGLLVLSSILFLLLSHYIITLFLLPARLYVIVELNQ